MRMRKKKNLTPRMEAAAEYLLRSLPPQTLKVRDIFGDENPVYIEIGCGKGGFICQHALLRPDINYIGVERVPDVIVTALERARAEKLPNLRFLCCEALTLRDLFEGGSFGRVFLNFPDPWPKNRHEKRRLTYKTYLELYKYLLGGGGLEFKTDNRPLFDYSLESFRQFGGAIAGISYDLHAQKDTGNLLTEYERKFSAQGIPINFARVVL